MNLLQASELQKRIDICKTTTKFDPGTNSVRLSLKEAEWILGILKARELIESKPFLVEGYGQERP